MSEANTRRMLPSPAPNPEMLRRALAEAPILSGLPAMDVIPYGCQCHFYWHFVHPHRQTPLIAYTSLLLGDKAYWDLFEWVMDLIFVPLEDAVYSFGSDEEGDFLWAIEPIGGDELICRLCTTYQGHLTYSGQAPGLPVEILDALAFRCGRHELIEILSQVLENLFRRDYQLKNLDAFDSQHYQGYLVLVKMWPWRLLGEWPAWQAGGQGDPPLARWHAEALLLETAAVAARKTEKYQQAQPRQQILLGHWWAIWCVDLAEHIVRQWPEADLAGHLERMAGFAAYLQAADAIHDSLRVFWDGIPFYDTSYEAATASKAIEDAWWWVAHARESMRQALPGWQRDEAFDWFRLSFPQLYQHYSLQLVRNELYLACFGPVPPAREAIGPDFSSTREPGRGG